MLGSLKTVGGIFRVYAKQISPLLQIYVSPVNIDPADPAMPITAPESYSRTLARDLGPFYTQGMAQDTAALRQGVLNRAEYRAQSRLVSLEHLGLLRHELRRFESGLLFFHFFGVDQDSHMLWGKYEDELLDTYRMVDDAIAEVRRAAPEATLIVMSDHGFSTFDRTVHLNAWLAKEGFLTLDDPKNAGNDELFQHVDWSRTQAYSVGLNGLYLNLQGREREGIVEPGAAAEALLRKIEDRLLAWRDSEGGRPRRRRGAARAQRPVLPTAPCPTSSSAITPATALPGRPRSARCPCGKSKTTARSGAAITASPRASSPAFSSPTGRLAAREPRLQDLPVTLLAEFGVAASPAMSGKTVF